MPGAQWPRRMVLLGLLGVAAAALAIPCFLLARDTTSHDWYAAGKLTFEEVRLAVGQSRFDFVAYRRKQGDTWELRRAVFVKFEPPVEARRRILGTVGDGVMLGAGVGGTVFCLMLLGAASHWRRGRTGTALEPAEGRFPHPSAWGRPAVPVEDQVRAGLRMRIALLVVSPADLERLLAPPGPKRRPGFVDLPGPDSVNPMETDGGKLERSDAPSLPPPTRAARLPSPERADPTPRAAIAAETAPARPRSRPNTNKRDGTAGDEAVVPRRKPGEEFF